MRILKVATIMLLILLPAAMYSLSRSHARQLEE